MHKVSIGQIQNHADQEVTLEGWIYNKRSSVK
jgi:aspartyl/asparaginyl-tRNA synthetase